MQQQNLPQQPQPQQELQQYQQQQQPPQPYYKEQQPIVVHDTSGFPQNANGAQFPVQVKWPQCQQVGMTKVSKNTCNCKTCLWFWTTGCFCCFIPGCCKNQTQYDHECLKCGAKLGSKDADCCCC